MRSQGIFWTHCHQIIPSFPGIFQVLPKLLDHVQLASLNHKKYKKISEAYKRFTVEAIQAHDSITVLEWRFQLHIIYIKKHLTTIHQNLAKRYTYVQERRISTFPLC